MQHKSTRECRVPSTMRKFRSHGCGCAASCRNGDHSLEPPRPFVRYDCISKCGGKTENDAPLLDSWAAQEIQPDTSGAGGEGTWAPRAVTPRALPDKILVGISPLGLGSIYGHCSHSQRRPSATSRPRRPQKARCASSHSARQSLPLRRRLRSSSCPH